MYVDDADVFFDTLSLAERPIASGLVGEFPPTELRTEWRSVVAPAAVGVSWEQVD